MTSPLRTHIGEVLDFLTNLMHGGTGYSCKNTAKYAIGSYTVLHDGKLIKDDKLVARFMKRIFNLKPPRMLAEY